MVAASCPRCANVVSLHEGRPIVTAAGTVELWHATCWERRDEPVIVPGSIVVAPSPELAPIAPVRRRRSRWSRRGTAIAGSVSAAAVFALVIGFHTASGAIEEEQVDSDSPVVERTSLRTANSAHESQPPAPPPDPAADEVVDLDGETLDQEYPTLASWIHPITRAAQHVPTNPARGFGALRHGVDRSDCGAGHCGIDLDGPFGRPLVAVADGVINHVERRELGADGRSGRYVRILHDDGTLTSYMHMDKVDPQLQVGDRVIAGQYIGTLGKSAVEVAHLHFSLEVPKRRGSHDTTFAGTRFVDPGPFLLRAQVVDSAERRHVTRPAL